LPASILEKSRIVIIVKPVRPRNLAHCSTPRVPVSSFPGPPPKKKKKKKKKKRKEPPKAPQKRPPPPEAPPHSVQPRCHFIGVGSQDQVGQELALRRAALGRARAGGPARSRALARGMSRIVAKARVADVVDHPRIDVPPERAPALSLWTPSKLHTRGHLRSQRSAKPARIRRIQSEVRSASSSSPPSPRASLSALIALPLSRSCPSRSCTLRRLQCLEKRGTLLVGSRRSAVRRQWRDVPHARTVLCRTKEHHDRTGGTNIVTLWTLCGFGIQRERRRSVRHTPSCSALRANILCACRKAPQHAPPRHQFPWKAQIQSLLLDPNNSTRIRSSRPASERTLQRQPSEAAARVSSREPKSHSSRANACHPLPPPVRAYLNQVLVSRGLQPHSLHAC